MQISKNTQNQDNVDDEVEGFEVVQTDETVGAARHTENRTDPMGEEKPVSTPVPVDTQLADDLAHVHLASENPQQEETDDSSESEIEWVQITVPVYKRQRRGRFGPLHNVPPGHGPAMRGLGPLPPLFCGPFGMPPHPPPSPFLHHGQHGGSKAHRHHRAHSPPAWNSFKFGGPCGHGFGRGGLPCSSGFRARSPKADKGDHQVATDDESNDKHAPEGVRLGFRPRCCHPPCPVSDDIPGPLSPIDHRLGFGRGGRSGFGGRGGHHGRGLHYGPPLLPEDFDSSEYIPRPGPGHSHGMFSRHPGHRGMGSMMGSDRRGRGGHIFSPVAFSGREYEGYKHFAPV